MSLNGLHILLAEDNPTNQMVAVQMLETLGATVTLAVDGADALDKLDGASFDVGLIDIEMPRISGTEVIRRVRAGPAPTRDMPLIALTAYVMREHHLAIDEAGADGVIAKPILSIEQLGDDIISLMRRRAAEFGGNHSRGQVLPRAAVVGTVGARPGSDDPAGDAPDGISDTDLEVIDLEIYDQLETSIGEAAMRELLERVAEDFDFACTRITDGLAQEERKTLRDATHALTAVAGVIGAIHLQKHAQCLNSAAHTGETSELKRQGALTLREIARALRFVRSRS